RTQLHLPRLERRHVHDRPGPPPERRGNHWRLSLLRRLRQRLRPAAGRTHRSIKRMGKFLLGLIIGVIVGVVAIASNPELPEEVRAGLSDATALVMRGTERVADAVGDVAGEAADEAGE